MEPLFATEQDYEEFNKRQSSYKVTTGDLASYKGNCYLGIDAGSTTTKTALVGEDGSLLYSFYSNNNGTHSRLQFVVFRKFIRNSRKKRRLLCSTGYLVTGRTCISNLRFFREFRINFLNRTNCSLEWASIVVAVERIQKTSVLSYQCSLCRRRSGIDTKVAVTLIASQIARRNLVGRLASC